MKPGPGGDSPTASGQVTAARLASDQAVIESARADLVDARQQLGLAVLRSTRSGRIASLDVARGDAVSAGDAAAVVVGGRAVTVGTSVPESKIGQVAVGQRVRVSTPGESTTAEGTVTRIGLVADISSGTPSYEVTVTVEDPAIAVPAGSRALLAIVVATARDVVTVPTSAILRRGNRTSVRTWDGRTLTDEPVTVATVGGGEVDVCDDLRRAPIIRIEAQPAARDRQSPDGFRVTVVIGAEQHLRMHGVDAVIQRMRGCRAGHQRQREPQRD